MDEVYDRQLRSSCALSRETQIGSRPNDESTNAVYKAACFRLPRGHTLRTQTFLERTRPVEICEFSHRSDDHILKCVSGGTCILPNFTPLHPSLLKCRVSGVFHEVLEFDDHVRLDADDRDREEFRRGRRLRRWSWILGDGLS